MSAITSQFEFTPSRQATALIAAGGIVAVSATLIIPMPPPITTAAAALLAALFTRAARTQALLRGKRAITGITFRSRGIVTVQGENGQDIDSGEITNSTISPLLTTATIAGQHHHYHLIIMQDSLPPEEFRHLRISLTANTKSARAKTTKTGSK